MSIGRKTRRKIKRRKKSKHISQRKGFVGNLVHFFLSGKVTDRYTKITTLIIIILEITWVALEIIWFTIDMMYGGYWG